MGRDFGFRNNKFWTKRLYLVDDNGVHHEIRIDTTGNILVNGKKLTDNGIGGRN